MINPFAESFMIATRTRSRPFWETPGFDNRRERPVPTRLTAAPKDRPRRRRFRLFGQDTAADMLRDPRDL